MKKIRIKPSFDSNSTSHKKVLVRFYENEDPEWVDLYTNRSIEEWYDLCIERKAAPRAFCVKYKDKVYTDHSYMFKELKILDIKDGGTDGSTIKDAYNQGKSFATPCTVKSDMDAYTGCWIKNILICGGGFGYGGYLIEDEFLHRLEIILEKTSREENIKNREATTPVNEFGE